MNQYLAHSHLSRSRSVGMIGRSTVLLVMYVCFAANCRGQVSIQPFHLERGLYQRDGTGKLTVFRREVLARRADGSTAFVEVDAYPPKLISTRKVTMLDGSATWVVDAFQIKTSWSSMVLDEAKTLVSRIRTTRGDCGLQASDIVGYEMIQGQRVVVALQTFDSVRRLKFWLAPALGCEMMQFSQTATQADGTYSIVTEGRLLSFSLGEPDARLFDLGAGYTEVVPSEIKTRRLHAIGSEPDDEDRRTGLGLDRQYRAQRREVKGGR